MIGKVLLETWDESDRMYRFELGNTTRVYDEIQGGVSVILYFTDRHMNVLGQASTHLPEG